MKINDLLIAEEIQYLEELKAGKYAQVASLLGALAAQHGGKAADAASIGYKQQVPHALATLATYADPKKLSALPVALSADELNKDEDEWKRQREKQKIGRLIPSIKEGHVQRNGAAFSFRGLRLHFYRDHVFYVVQGGPNISIYKDGVPTPRNDEIYVKDAAAHGVPKDIITIISTWLNTPLDKQEALLPRIEAAMNHIIDGWLKQSAAKKENAMKMNELDNRLPDNFSIDDIKKMERMTDINQMKSYAKELISTPSQKPMRPEKVAWLKKTIDSKRKPIDVIKLMYDLMLGGEGKHVIGSRHSMDPNVYRKTFKEEDGKTMSRAGKGVMKYGKDGMKALAKAGRDGASDEKLDKLRDKYNKYDEGTEPDHEASMAKGQLYNAAKNALALMKMIEDGDNLEGWVASKISRAADYLNSVHDYMAYEEVSEGKQKGVDGKACWKGYKRMGTKQKGGKTVDNCVKIKK